MEKIKAKVTTTTATVYLYNRQTHNTETVVYDYNKKVSKAVVKNEIAKAIDLNTGFKLVDIVVSYSKKLYEISLVDFMEKATEVEQNNVSESEVE